MTLQPRPLGFLADCGEDLRQAVGGGDVPLELVEGERVVADDEMAVQEHVVPGRRHLLEGLGGDGQPVADPPAVDDDMVGAVLAKALFTVGDGGIVTVEESGTHGMSVEFVEGFEYDNGYISPYMVTNPASLEAILYDPYILISNEKITKVQQLMPVLDKVMRAPRPLVIIAENVEGAALSMLVQNHVNGIFQCVVTRAPGFGDRRRRLWR